jgi:hypothetical protein
MENKEKREKNSGLSESFSSQKKDEKSKSIYTNLIKSGALVFCILAILNTLALLTDLYFIVPWFDILMHGLGGVAVGFIVLAFLTRIRPQMRITLGVYISMVILMVVGWEVLEWVLSLTDLHLWASILDTGMDICMGVLGAGVAALYSKKYSLHV